MESNFYRAQRVDNGQWIEGNFINIKGRHFIISPFDNPDELKPVTIYANTLCRGTGRLDKNKKLIYTGDRVKYEFYSGGYLGICRFGEYLQDGSDGEYLPRPCLGFYIERTDVILGDWEDEDDREWKLKQYQATESLLDCDNIEVIGTVFDE
jgi:hypothetical protein